MANKQAAVALGFFDGVHIGHQRVIKKAVEMAGADLTPAVFTFVVGQNAPTGKSGRLLMDYRQREKALKRAGAEEIYAPDFREFCEYTGEDFVQKILAETMNAAAVCCGENFRFGKNAGWGVEELKNICQGYGIACETVPPVFDGGELVSSSRIRAAVEAGEMEEARRLLGRDFCYELEIEHGKGLGKKLNFPTMNQYPGVDLVLPRFGVYAAAVKIDGAHYAGVTNVGLRPTVENASVPCAETHLIGFDGDVYGKTAKTMFYRFLRAEKKFDTVKELRAQIQKDLENAAKLHDNALQDE